MGRKKKIVKEIKPNVLIKTIEADRFSDAVNKAPFFIMGNASAAWTRNGRPLEQKSLEKFCTEYLERHSAFEEDFGFIITVTKVNEARKEIYRKCVLKMLGRTRRKKVYSQKFFVLRDNEGKEVKVIDGTIRAGELKKEAKRVVNSLEFKGDRLTCHIEYRFPNNGNLVFEINRCKPTNRADKKGKYIVFGVVSIK